MFHLELCIKAEAWVAAKAQVYIALDSDLSGSPGPYAGADAGLQSKGVQLCKYICTPFSMLHVVLVLLRCY